MKKSMFLAGLAVISASVLGMIPNDQGENSRNRRRNFQQINEGNEDGRRVRARLAPGIPNVVPNAQNGPNPNVRPNVQNGQRANLRPVAQNGQRVNASRNNNIHTWSSINANRMKELFKGGLDIHSRDSWGSTALHIASMRGDLDLVRWILDYFVDIQGVVQLLCDGNNHTRLSNEDIMVLHDRAFPDRFNLVNAVNHQGETPLTYAVINAHLNVVRYLTEHGANVNAADQDGLTPLIKASNNGHLGIVRYLTEHGADVNATDLNGNTPLMGASQFGHLEIVRYLTEHGADVNAADLNGNTPLIKASNDRHLEIVRYLAEHGANINATDLNGNTPLMGASQFGHLEIVRYLTEHGADVNAADLNGNTPLIKASNDRHLEIVRYLAEHGANINATDYQGFTPLTWAVLYGKTDIVRYLASLPEINFNVKNYSSDYNGLTALGIARRENLNDIVQILRGAGARE